MGDNRNNSQDSRYWGFVKKEKIKGRAFIVYWSWDSEREDKLLWERVRWSRLGRLIY
jgi:signal peptidase I